MYIYVVIRVYVSGICINMLKGLGILFFREVMGYGNIKFKFFFIIFFYMYINVRKLLKYERLEKMYIKIFL